MYKKIGILGGLTPESTVSYYMHIVHRYQEIYGDHGYPEIIIYSVSFQKYENWMNNGDWKSIKKELLSGLENLHAAGAHFAIIATNTMHLLFKELEKNSPLFLIGIVDATAKAIINAGLKKIGLIGTRFTMEKPFYIDGLKQRGVESITPNPDERKYISEVISSELSRGILTNDSRKGYLDIIDNLVRQGAEGIVLGCTEIPLLIRQSDTKVKVFDTAVIHAERALQFAIHSK